MGTRKPKVDIRFSDDQGRTETLPAQSLGGGLYQMVHSPSFAYNISRKDTFRTEEGEAGAFIFNEIVEKSGNRTVRVLLARFSIDSPEIVAILEKVNELGCDYENMLPQLICINVPPEVEMPLLTNVLIEQRVWWEVADPNSQSEELI